MNSSIIQTFMEGVKFGVQAGGGGKGLENKIRIAVNMLVDEQPTENVSKWTGFDIGYVEYLSQELRYFSRVWAEDQKEENQ